ncbi:MAG: TIGR00282 family metallophosphoesterase [Patescibacteria group bacterium]
MKVLMIGDVVGRVGRRLITELIPKYRREENIDWVIINGENLAGGRGVNENTYQEMIDAGVDIITSGNHVFKLKEATKILSKKDTKLLRPANYPPGVPGRGWQIFTNPLGHHIAVINLIGRTFFKENFDCPFRAADQILTEINLTTKQENKKLDGIYIDFHAEATAEKISFAHYLTGRVTAVVGTHTHIPTCDETILNDHTAYITDLGMAGPVDSSLGMEKEISIRQYLTQLPQKFMWKTSGPGVMTGVVIKTKKGDNRALSIKRFSAQLD